MEHNQNQQPATPEEVWAILRSVSTKQQELSRLQKETDQQMKEISRMIKEAEEQQKETDQQMKETDRRIDKRMKKLEHMFTDQWDKLMESLVEGDLVALLKARDINVFTTYTRVKGRRNLEHYVYDLVAVNSDVAVVVEVKTTLGARDVSDFMEKLARFTVHVPLFQRLQVYGALVYLRVKQSADLYAERQGLFVIRATGSSASIVNQEDFQPRVFSQTVKDI